MLFLQLSKIHNIEAQNFQLPDMLKVNKKNVNIEFILSKTNFDIILQYFY